MKSLIILISLICISPFMRAADQTDSFETAVCEAVNRQMQLYPASTLRDLYKNFFQDKFGPGHIVADTTGAGNYLRRELASYEEITGDYAESTGWEGNYVRVNLSVIKEGLVPYPVFFDAFYRSVNGIVPPDVADWQEEWNRIEAVIASIYPDLPDYTADKNTITENLNRGEFVGHHSPQFESHYSPHYRIMSRAIYETEIKPLLPVKKN